MSYLEPLLVFGMILDTSHISSVLFLFCFLKGQHFTPHVVSKILKYFLEFNPMGQCPGSLLSWRGGGWWDGVVEIVDQWDMSLFFPLACVFYFIFMLCHCNVLYFFIQYTF